jgi:hypothetical protein
MTVRELKNLLNKFDGDKEVVIVDNDGIICFDGVVTIQ